MRAGRGAQGADDRSGNCSSLATESADGSGYQRAGVNRTEGDYDLVRAAPLGGMPPKGRSAAPTPVGNQRREYHQPKIQGRLGPSRRCLVPGRNGAFSERALPTTQPAYVQPSQTQSHLVKPSPTLNFPAGPAIRTHSCAFVAASICVHLCASVAPTQYGLIRPNTALNCFAENGVFVSCHLPNGSERRVFGLILGGGGDRMRVQRREQL